MKIFICHAAEDSDVASKLYEELEKHGFEPWLDKRKLIGGQCWRDTIREAIDESDYFLALLSYRSVTKKGFVQKEMRWGLDILSECPPGDIYLIPVRLDECSPKHPQLHDLHRVDLFPSYDEGFCEILRSIQHDEEEKLHLQQPLKLTSVKQQPLNSTPTEPMFRFIWLHETDILKARVEMTDAIKKALGAEENKGRTVNDVIGGQIVAIDAELENKRHLTFFAAPGKFEAELYMNQMSSERDIERVRKDYNYYSDKIIEIDRATELLHCKRDILLQMLK